MKTAILLLIAVFLIPIVSGADEMPAERDKDAEAAREIVHADKDEPVDPNSGQTVTVAAEAPQDPNDMAWLGQSFNSNFDEVFSIYVGESGRVDFAKLRRMRLVMLPVLQAMDSLSSEEYDSWDEQEKLAFWINARNLCTLKLVVDNYPIRATVYKSFFWPTKSVMQLDSPWSGPKYRIMGVNYTIDEITRRILLTRFDDPRIAFALTHAADWGPRLRNEPYYGRTLERQLDEQVREFIASEKGFRIDKERSTVYLSILFKATSFQADFVSRFGGDNRFNDNRAEIRAMLSYIGGYLDRTELDWLTGKKYSVSYMKPDWSLNE